MSPPPLSKASSSCLDGFHCCFLCLIHLETTLQCWHFLSTFLSHDGGYGGQECSAYKIASPLFPSNALLHGRYVAELTEEFEQKLGEDRQLRVQLHEEKTELDREFTETKHQVEDDIDTEIDNLR